VLIRFSLLQQTTKVINLKRGKVNFVFSFEDFSPSSVGLISFGPMTTWQDHSGGSCSLHGAGKQTEKGKDWCPTISFKDTSLGRLRPTTLSFHHLPILQAEE
jgi:hypothetical protein